MRKEILLAIIIGILVGLGVTFGLYLIRQRLGDTSTINTIEQSRQGENTTGNNNNEALSGTLTVQQPTADTYTTQSEIRVVGRAIPNSYIVVLSGENEFVTTADTDGDFSLIIQLVAGGNRVSIIATSPDGDQETLVRSIVYSTVDLNNPTASESATATTSAQPTATNSAQNTAPRN